MLYLAGQGELADCRQQATKGLFSGKAREKFLEMITAQGGNIDIFTGKRIFPEAPCLYDLAAPKSGYFSITDTEILGRAAMLLGAGRENLKNTIDYTAVSYTHLDVYKRQA